MDNILEYKGYHTRVIFDPDTLCLRGKIEGINDFVDFETDRLDAVEAEFHQAVDEYLAFCKEVGKDPEKEYKGMFNVRISPALHKKISYIAFSKNESLNSVVEEAIAQYAEKEE